MIVKIILVALSAVVVAAVLFRYTTLWARSLQALYIKESIKLYGSSDGWDEKWRLNLFRVMVVWGGIMLVLGVYVLVFSPNSVN